MGTITELIDSRYQTQADGIAERSTAKFSFIADGYADEPAALAAVLAWLVANIGSTYGTMIYHSSEVSEQIREGVWRIKSTYIDPPATTTQFDSIGGTQHITRSIATVATYCSADPTLGGLVPDQHRAIGVDGENVAGVDIVVPVYTWTEIVYLNDADLLIPAYYALAGHTNNAPFADQWGNVFDTREVLFYGATGTEREDGLWEVQFKFGYQKNATGLSVGPISGIDKKGWEYLWIYYGNSVATSQRIKLPLFAYVEQVYPDGDFSTLGI